MTDTTTDKTADTTTEQPAVQAEQPAAEATGSNGGGDTLQGPVVLGELLPDELQRLQTLRQQTEQGVYQLGRATLQLLRMHRGIEQMEAQAQGVLNGVGARLGITQGTAWSVTGDGKAILVGEPPQADS